MNDFSATKAVRAAGMSDRPGYYSGRGALWCDLRGEQLETIYQSIKTGVGAEAASAFVTMVDNIEVLSATDFLLALFALEARDWKLSPEMIPLGKKMPEFSRQTSLRSLERLLNVTDIEISDAVKELDLKVADHGQVSSKTATKIAEHLGFRVPQDKERPGGLPKGVHYENVGEAMGTLVTTLARQGREPRDETFSIKSEFFFKRGIRFDYSSQHKGYVY